MIGAADEKDEKAKAGWHWDWVGLFYISNFWLPCFQNQLD
jgi:hypothetical protein